MIYLKVIVISVAVLLPGYASAQFPSADWDKWAVCETAKDCAVMQGVCGTIEAINGKYTDEYLAYIKYMEQISNCSNPGKANIQNIAAVCVVKKCAVAAPVVEETQ